jgi:hypothetical protein
MSQILYVPCKCHGDVYVAIKKTTLEVKNEKTYKYKQF